MKKLLWMVAVAVLSSAFAAQAAHVGLYADAGGNTTHLAVTQGQPFSIYVVLTATPEALGTQFKVDLPPTFVSNTINAGFSSPFVDVLGNPTSGIGVGFGSCANAPVHVLTMNFIATGSFECELLHVVAHPFDAAVVVFDCSGQPQFASGGTAWVRTGPPIVFDRYPPDGATNVVRDITVSWNESWCQDGYDCGGPFCGETVYFGTDPSPPEWGVVSEYIRSFSPGPLAANTTYYWRMAPAYVPEEQPVYSFTTGAEPIAAELSTWSRIKALYR